MKYSRFLCRLFAATLLLPTYYAAMATEEALPPVKVIPVSDFGDLAREAKHHRKLIMLEVSASYCGYCEKLEEELIKPMLLSGEYTDVLIRKVDIDSYNSVLDFNGNEISGSKLARQLDIMVTPTLIFLNSENQEVSKRIVGVNSLDFMGAYVDDAIEQGLTVIR